MSNPSASMIEAFSSLPAQESATMQLLALLDDPNSEARDIVPVIEADPAMTARIITLANSAFFGTRTRAANAWAAVMVVGFNVVRALSTAGALGINRQSTDVPENYFGHAVASAAGATVVARHTNVRASDAFAAALLHDIGALLMHRAEPAKWSEVVADTPSGPQASLRAERHVFGTTHDEVAASVLRHLYFPDSIVDAAAEHNQGPTYVGSKLSQVVIAGIALAEAADVPSATDPVAPVEEALVALGMSPHVDPLMFEQLHEEISDLRAVLG